MKLVTPEEISAAAEGALLLRVQGAGGQVRASTDAPTLDESSEAPGSRVTIGEPQWWDVARAYAEEGTRTPAALTQLLEDSAFYVVRFACSLRVDDDSHVEWARFQVALQCVNGPPRRAIAFDLHPLELLEQSERNLHVSVSPALTFANGVEARLGEAAFDLHYTQLTPVITAVGAQEAEFDWHLRSTREHPLRGTRWFHAVLRVPHDADGVQATLNLTAQITSPRGRFRGSLRNRKTQPLTRLICV